MRVGSATSTMIDLYPPMAIRKIISHPSVLPYAHLYLDDIEEICRILTSALTDCGDPGLDDPKTFETVFTTGQLALDSIEDLEQLGGSATNFTVKLRMGYKECDVEFRSYAETRASLYSLNSDLIFATHAKLTSLFEQRELTFRNVVARLPWWLPSLAMMALIYAAVPVILALHWNRIAVAGIYLGVLAILLYLGSRPSRVSFVRSHERSKLSRGRRSEYLGKIIFLIAGGLIGALISKLIK
jgi:hypothetical protein